MIKILLTALCFLLVLSPCFAPPAYAQIAGCDLGSTCSAVDFSKGDITENIASCAVSGIQACTTAFASPMVSFFQEPLIAALVLSLVMLGLRVMGYAGNPSGAMQQAASWVMRIGFLVLLYSGNTPISLNPNNTYNLYKSVFSFEKTLQSCFSGNCSSGDPTAIFGDIDADIINLFQIGQNNEISSSIISLVALAAISSSAGVLLLLSAVNALLGIIFFGAKILVTYLLAWTAIAATLILGVAMLPLAVFYNTERYATSWLSILLSAMLIPPLLFAVTSLFIGLIGDSVSSIYKMVNGTSGSGADFTTLWQGQRASVSWLVQSDPASAYALKQKVGASSIGVAPVASHINPLMRYSQKFGSLTSPGADFGSGSINLIKQMIYQFIEIWLYTSFLQQIIAMVPSIAQGISGAAIEVSVGDSEIGQTAKNNISKLTKSVSKGGK